MNNEPIQLAITGMTCASCVSHVEKALKKVPGVTEAAVNLATEKAQVKFENNVTVEQLISAVEAAGYEAKEINHTHPAKPNNADMEVPRK